MFQHKWTRKQKHSQMTKLLNVRKDSVSNTVNVSFRSRIIILRRISRWMVWKEFCNYHRIDTMLKNSHLRLNALRDELIKSLMKRESIKNSAIAPMKAFKAMHYRYPRMSHKITREVKEQWMQQCTHLNKHSRTQPVEFSYAKKSAW